MVTTLEEARALFAAEGLVFAGARLTKHDIKEIIAKADAALGVAKARQNSAAKAGADAVALAPFQSAVTECQARCEKVKGLLRALILIDEAEKETKKKEALVAAKSVAIEAVDFPRAYVEYFSESVPSAPEILGASETVWPALWKMRTTTARSIRVVCVTGDIEVAKVVTKRGIAVIDEKLTMEIIEAASPETWFLPLRRVQYDALLKPPVTMAAPLTTAGGDAVKAVFGMPAAESVMDASDVSAAPIIDAIIDASVRTHARLLPSLDVAVLDSTLATPEFSENAADATKEDALYVVESKLRDIAAQALEERHRSHIPRSWNADTIVYLMTHPIRRRSVLTHKEELWWDAEKRVIMQGPTNEVDLDGPMALDIKARMEAMVDEFALRNMSTKSLQTMRNEPLLCFTPEQRREGFVLAARRQVRRPRQAWLKSLKWDGEPRIKKILPSYLHVDDDDDTAADFLMMWMRGAVMRTMLPGYDFRYCLVLLSKLEDAGKSTFFSSLFPNNCVTITGDLQDKDNLIRVGKHGCVVLGEMAPIVRPRDAGATKELISAGVDNVRAPYGRLSESVRRWCVFATSGNDIAPFNDVAGDSRYLPIEVKERIRGSEVKENYTQLWAEAATLWWEVEACEACQAELQQTKEYTQGMRGCPVHHPTMGDELRARHARKIAEHRETAIETPIVLEWAERQNKPFTLTELLMDAFNLGVKEINRSRKNEVSKILRFWGYDDVNVPDGKGRKHRVWMLRNGSKHTGAQTMGAQLSSLLTSNAGAPEGLQNVSTEAPAVPDYSDTE